MESVMETKSHKPVNTKEAERIWAEYETNHDLSGLRGKTAGIDPITGNIWIGDSIFNVIDQRDAAGVESLLFFVRIGYRTYFTKCGRV
jgi:hypothetical protein